MSTDTISALTGLADEYHAIAHNLANANTTGYKRLVGTYTVSGPLAGASGETAATGGTATAPQASTGIDFSQGRLVRTGRSLDAALSGKGFFVLETDRGERYTRNGVFRANAQGQLVDGAGRTVAGEGGPVMIPTSVSPMQVAIASDGRILAGGTAIGQLRIVEFEDPSVLEPEGSGAFVAPADAQPGPAQDTTVQQGFQEGSNVDAVTELVGLIQVTRLYQANVQVMADTGDRAKDLLRIA
ncbi:MAG: flagellar hook basal-body protein, partial [Planctomycetota bacterium]|nr:flagellar hook basal-body protein [Planctomycetota bacterium]